MTINLYGISKICTNYNLNELLATNEKIKIKMRLRYIFKSMHSYFKFHALKHEFPQKHELVSLIGKKIHENMIYETL